MPAPASQHISRQTDPLPTLLATIPPCLRCCFRLSPRQDVFQIRALRHLRARAKLDRIWHKRWSPRCGASLGNRGGGIQVRAELRARALSLYEGGQSAYAISRALGVPASTVRYWVDNDYRDGRKYDGKYVRLQTCPDCRAVRQISYESFRRISIGRLSGLCRSCSVSRRRGLLPAPRATAELREWWLARYTIAELRRLAAGLVEPSNDYSASARHARREFARDYDSAEAL